MAWTARLPPARALLAFAALACTAGCGEGASDGESPGTGGGAGATQGPTALTFDPSETITMVPGELRSVTVVASPPGHYPVSFALLGDSKDAALDRSEADTDASGRASVALTAPASARTFSLRASSGTEVSASIAVSVSASGFGSLQVSPAYAGKRSVSHWVASVRTGVTCEDLSGDLLADGDLKASAPFGETPQVDDIPVGPALAVTLRGAASIAGCKDVADLAAGEVEAVSVPVLDLPMDLEGTELDVVLGLEGGKGKWPELLGLASVTSALSPASNDASALLNAMQQAAQDATANAAFQAARKGEGWDALVQTSIGGPSALRSLVEPWLAAGASTFAAPDTFRGRLTGAAGGPANAWLDLTAVAGADPLGAGFSAKYLTSWQAHADDSLALGFELHLLPSRLATTLAIAPAKAQVAGANTVPEALAELLSCKKVAAAILAPGPSPTEAFPKCDAACAEALCGAGLENLWAAAADASVSPAVTPASISVAATAAATVDDSARPSAFVGTWVGSFESGGLSLPVNGSATGKQPPPPE
jgi:hypothetical protein